MAQIVAQDGGHETTPYTFNTDDDLLVNLGTLVVVQTGPAVIVGAPGAHLLEINGTLMGQSGIWAIATELPGAVTLRIGPSGRVMADPLSVTSGDAITVTAKNTLIDNRGEISGIYGVVLGATSGGVTQINNRGLIQAGAYAFFRADDVSGDNVNITNSGKILSSGASLGFQNAGGNVRLVNTGLIEGDIYFGRGDDLYDGSKGQIISSVPGMIVTIEGGFGVNTYRPGLSAERIDGRQSPEDRLDFRFTGAAVRVALDGSFANTGAARGDIYLGIDEVTGSRRNDWLRGDAARNTLSGDVGNDKLEGRGEDDYLYGGGGNDLLAGDDGYDRLYGGAGRDKLVGGAGNDFLFSSSGRDTLIGGAGDDYFLFAAPRDGGDVINDFSNAMGNDDRLVFLARGFGLRAEADRMATADEFLITRGHHRAKDREDRFIFDAKSTTLWFDSDGTGRKAAVLIADFAPGVRLGLGDILIGNG